MLELLTFTGFDNRTHLRKMLDIGTKYPGVEIGVLVGSTTGQGYKIFPPMSTVDFLRDMQPTINTAIHLCGKYARGLMAGGEGLEEALAVSDGFGRVQINLHGDAFYSKAIDAASSAVATFIDRSKAHSVILQHRSSWHLCPMTHDRLEYLYDRSEGSGLVDFRSWPVPPARGRWGYAGGIGPRNIGEAIKFNRRYEDRSLWFDMESQVRTNGWFDLKKVLAVCEIAFKRPNE